MAATLVGGAFLSATLQVLFDRMASRPVLDLIHGRKFSTAPLNKLKIKLLAVKAVLNDAEQKQFTEPLVKTWLDELKHVVYIAQDLVDDISTDSLRCELKLEPHVCRDQVRKSSSISLSSLDERMKLKVEEILERLEYIAKQKDLLGLKEIVETKPSQRLPSTSLVEESGVYGRDEDKEKIIEFLLSDDSSGNEIGVIPIVGMGGVGKTTLAQLVYNEDDKLKNHFNLKAWVCVSEEFDVVRVTKTILEAVTFSSCDIKDLNLLQIKLKESLTGKKFLLILDDVWNENYNHWDILRKPFRFGAKGSKIIVTTRNENVAMIMRSVSTHHLNQLSDTNCWLLFAKHAFDNNNNSDKRPELEVIGQKIVEKCKGLPLAAKTLGGLLRSKADAADWYKILESELWKLPNDKNDILPALILSYHYLPSHLKCCFAYCSIFPKDCEFVKKEVVLLWMAEDFLQDPAATSKQMEEVGHEYFDELVSRSFFQRASQAKSRFVMHDLVNDLANFVSGEFCFRSEGEKLCAIPEKTRHLSYANGGLQKFDSITDAKLLRSFLALDSALPLKSFFSATDEVPEHLFLSPRCLRMLSLSPYSKISEVSESIGELKYLRYLNLSGIAIQKLPESTSALCNLQTLLLSGCESLTELPVNTEKLINLRHLDVSGTNLKEMPMHMSHLINLQTLSTFFVGKNDGSTITELRELKHLQGALDILNLQNVADARDAQKANLKDKTHLEKLLLEWSSETIEEDSQTARDVLDKLQPQNKLKELTINQYGGTRFPEWLGDQSFSNMVSLCLSNCKYCFFLPPLGMLPSLRDLSIIEFHVVESVGPEFYGSAPSSIKPFRSLEILRFKGMPEWEEWFCYAEFLHLKELYIEDCPKLKGGLPDHLRCLTMLVMTSCQQLVAALPKAELLCQLELNNCDKMVLFSGNNDTILQPSLSLGVPEIPIEVELERRSWCCLQILKILNMSDLKEFPSWLMQSLLITEMYISNCSSLESFPMSDLPTTLKKLDISQCGKLDLHLPDPDDDIQMTHYSSASLESLSVQNGCDSLKSFPLGLFPKLECLEFIECTSLEFIWIPEGAHVDHLASLDSLYILSCPELESFPNNGRLPIPKLTCLGVSHCKSLKSLPEQMHNLLPSLEFLLTENCPELESFPEGGLPSSLRSLHICDCIKLEARRLEWGLKTLPNLKEFIIRSSVEGKESFPEEWLLPSSLITLEIISVPNLKYMNKSGLQHLISLEELSIQDCPELQSLTVDDLPNSLSSLIITECPLLEQWCQREKREGWPKIAHIPYIIIDGKLI